MNDKGPEGSAVKTYVSRPLLGVLAVLLAVIVTLLLLNRFEQLQLRPASGAANAISQAAAPPAETARK